MKFLEGSSSMNNMRMDENIETPCVAGLEMVEIT